VFSLDGYCWWVLSLGMCIRSKWLLLVGTLIRKVCPFWVFAAGGDSMSAAARDVACVHSSRNVPVEAWLLGLSGVVTHGKTQGAGMVGQLAS
jgi:hypothetical protein